MFKMIFDDIDTKVLRENFDEELLNQINEENVSRIYIYLIKEGIYYAKDLVIEFLDLFLLPTDDFIQRFEKLKSSVGDDYIEKLGQDISLIEMMYKE